MLQGSYQYFRHERIVFGKPYVEALEAAVKEAGAQRVFTVATRSLSRRTPIVRELLASLGEKSAGLFDDCIPHVPRAAVLTAAEAAREARPDLIVAIGGGSAIDTAKMVLVALGEQITALTDFDRYRVGVDGDGRAVVPAIASAGIRHIALPTTLSGSEFSHTAGCVDEVEHSKDLYIQADLAPQAVILDPAVTVHTPDWVWLASGMRGVDHAVESICSPTANPYTDATCVKGLTALGRSLVRTHSDPSDLEARQDAQLGVWLASTGMMRGQYGASHGLSFHLSAIADVPHGHCSCVLLPAVLRWNEPANTAQQAVVSQALERPNDPAAEVVQDLVRSLGMPERLRDVGIERRHFEKIANDAMANSLVRSNPRRIDSPAQVLEILELAW